MFPSPTCGHDDEARQQLLLTFLGLHPQAPGAFDGLQGRHGAAAADLGPGLDPGWTMLGYP